MFCNILGDSISLGSKSYYTDNYSCIAFYLQPLLDSIETNIWTNSGKSGGTTQCIIDEFDFRYVKIPKNLCIFHVGINDIYYNVTEQQIKTNFETIFSMLDENVVHIFMSIPYSIRDSANESKITLINTWLENECNSRGYLFFDYFNWSKSYTSDLLYYSDGLHPTKYGYNLIAKNLSEFIRLYLINI